MPEALSVAQAMAKQRETLAPSTTCPEPELIARLKQDQAAQQGSLGSCAVVAADSVLSPP